MKKSAVKTIGAAALGAAFAATAAGVAAAETPEALTSLDSVTSVVPVQDTLTKLPAGAPESLTGGRAALTESASTLPGTLQGTGERVLAADATEPVKALLGGLPVGDLTKGLTGGGLA
jgi:hypothetical protein